MDMMNANTKYRLSDKELVYKDIGGGIWCEEWEYTSIVGMMMYLAGSIRPDKSYGIHQCARCLRNPKKSSEVALEYIAHCLKGTKTK